MEDRELERLRGEIDRVDAELLRLFAERMRLADQIGAYKAEHALPVRAEGREAEILPRVRERAGADLADGAEELFRTLTALSRARQQGRSKQATAAWLPHALMSSSPSGCQCLAMLNPATTTAAVFSS